MTLEQIQESLAAIDGMLIAITTKIDQVNALAEANKANLASLETQLASVDSVTSLEQRVAIIESLIEAE